MAVKRRLMIPLTRSHFCCCSPTLSLHSAEVVMKRFTRHRAAEDAVLVGRAFCWCCYCFITIFQKPFILNFLLNMGLISTAWAVRPLSPTLTIFLPVALQCVGGLESVHQQLVLCVQSLQSQRSVVLETWDISVSPQVPPYLGPHVMAVVLPDHWFCSADRTDG